MEQCVLPAAPPVPVCGDASSVHGERAGTPLGGKYETHGSLLLASSSDRNWRTGLGAEIRRHSDLHCPAFLQPVNEVAIALSGTAKVQRRAHGEEQKFVARIGNACVCPSGVAVRYLHIAQGSLDMLHLYLPDDLFGLLEHGVQAHAAGLCYLGGLQDPLVVQIGAAIADDLARPSDGSARSLMVESLAIGLTARLVERHAVPGQARAALARVQTQSQGGLDPRRLRRVLDFIDAHAGSSPTLESMAQQACLSRFHFVRAFKQTTGQTPLAYVNAVRLERAKRLLQDKHCSVEDIALRLNFSSGSNFVRAFRRAVGVTPGTYRQMR